MPIGDNGLNVILYVIIRSYYASRGLQAVKCRGCIFRCTIKKYEGLLTAFVQALLFQL